MLTSMAEALDVTRNEALWSWPAGGDPFDASLEIFNWTTNGSLFGGNGSANESGPGAPAGSLEWWTSAVYPSGYTPLGLVVASVFVTFIMIIIVGGNVLVIIAIATERSLKGIQNWFIGSLAVADCLLGLIIMPFSLANEMMGYWVFGQWWCDVHSAVDVLLCTSSIMNLCLISLDRYWSITHAIEYLRKRTPERVVIMIATVWILSGLISIPPLLGWKKETPQGEFPKCELSEDIGYVLYSALGSFYIPSCIMVFVYIRIYFAARERARRAQENKIKRRQSQNNKERKELEERQHHQQNNHNNHQTIQPFAAAPSDKRPDEAPQVAPPSQIGQRLASPEQRHHHPNGSVNKDHDEARRHSVTTGDELRGLRLSPRLSSTSRPFVSMDRLTKPEKRSPKLLHSTAPSSLMAINESSRRPVSTPVTPPSTRQVSPVPDRHCITFQCPSSDGLTLVTCSFDAKEPDNNNEEITVTCATTVLLTAEANSSTARRASLLLPTKRKFEIFARRLGGCGAEVAHVVHPQHSVVADSPTTAAMRSECDWSTSSYPSSPGHVQSGVDYHVCPRPAAPGNLSSPPGTSAGDPGPGAANSAAATNHAAAPATQNGAGNNHRKRRDEAQDAMEMASDTGLEPSSSDSGTMARCTVVRPLKIRFCRPSSSGSVKKSSKAKRQVIDTGRVVVREKDPGRERRRISRQREKRATLILGLIMGAFIACWLPFFFLYLLAPMCKSCNIQPWGFAFAFWLGYINSALNPVIYTIFNKDFRRAFRRIIFRCTIAHY